MRPCAVSVVQVDGLMSQWVAHSLTRQSSRPVSASVNVSGAVLLYLQYFGAYARVASVRI